MAGLSGPILFLIPARGDSVRIPGKNLRTVAGIPLVGRAIVTALRAAAVIDGGPHRIVCSTDDQAIAAAARSWGAEVLDRPAELATATASSVDVALHALDVLEPGDEGRPFRALVLVQPTSPLTDPADLVAAVERFAGGGERSVASITTTHPASWHVTREEGSAGGDGPIGRIEGGDSDEILTGAVYVIAPSELRTTRRFVGPGTIGLSIPPERSVDIDEPHDLVVAEALAAARTGALAAARSEALAAARTGALAAARSEALAAARTGALPGTPAGDSIRPEPGASDGRSPEPGPAAGPTGGGAIDARRTIAVLTTGRQDWGILHSTADAIRAHPDLRLRLLAGGMHVSARHGSTIDEVRADGFEPDALLDWLAADGRSVGTSDRGDRPADQQAGAALAAVGAELRANPVSALVLVGDRFETAAAALAATVCRVPIVHLHGGEQTLGAFDDALRHAITKLAHLHLVSHTEHAARVVALGEDPASVHVVGAPGLDALARPDLPDRVTLAAELGLELRLPVVVVTVHPTTLDVDPAAAATAVAAAMDQVPATYVVTLPNVDPGAGGVAAILEAAAAAKPGRLAVAALGERRYWGLLRIADAVLGNSSSGVSEAPAVGLPVVNVGDRQAGRLRLGPVLDVPADAAAVAEALRRVLTPGYRASLPPPDPWLADGRAGERVAHIIAEWHPSIPPRKPPIAVDP